MGSLPLETVRYYAAQIVVALEHLHTNGIVHRDLKPQNIMIAHDFVSKLIDFGDSLIEGESDKPPEEEEEKEERTTATSEATSESEKFVEFKAHDESSDEDGYSAMQEY